MSAQFSRWRCWLCKSLAIVGLGACAEPDDLGEDGINPSDKVAVQQPFVGPFEKPADSVATGVCVRVPWGGGKVKWGISNPAAAGYSVAPEGTPNLIWAAAPEQSIDAIHRRSWGCGTAFKVPDNCTATVTSSGIDCCCNLAASAIWGVCRYVNTWGPATTSNPDGYFADCPL